MGERNHASVWETKEAVKKAVSSSFSFSVAQSPIFSEERSLGSGVGKMKAWMNEKRKQKWKLKKGGQRVWEKK